MDYQWVDTTAKRDLWIARGLALAAAVVLTGIVVAIGLALAAADNTAERDVFALVGARPTSLRRMAASAHAAPRGLTHSRDQRRAGRVGRPAEACAATWSADGRRSRRRYG